MKHPNEPEYADPKPPGWRLLTNAEADELRSELHEVMKELKAADQGDEVFLTPAARMRLEVRRDDLKRQLSDAERKPVGPAATTENEKTELAFNEEALERALSKATPAQRKEFSAEVRKLGKAVDELAKNAEAFVATAVATNAGGADDDDLFADPRPYWK